MRLILLLSLAMMFCAGTASAQDPKAFHLQLGASSVDLDAGETVDVTLPDGSTAKVTLTRNAFLAYVAATFSFVHPSTVSVAKSDLGDGIVQHLLATAVGTVILLQEYPATDPATLNQLMIDEMTKESVAAGAKVEQKASTRQTPSGKTLTGLTATDTLGEEISDYEVFSYSKGSSGVIIVTKIRRSDADEDAPMLKKFWETFDAK